MNHSKLTSVEATVMEQPDDFHIRAGYVAAIKAIDLCCICQFVKKIMNLVILAEKIQKNVSKNRKIKN